MSQSPLNRFSEQLLAFLRKAKEVLSKDYSIQDLKNLKSLPKTLQDKLSSSGMTASLHAKDKESSPASSPFDFKRLPELMGRIVEQQRTLLILLLLAVVLLLLNAFVIAPYGQNIQNQLEMRPAQWSQLQSLLKAAKSSSPAAAQSPSYGGGVATVTLLDDMELQKIRGILTARGFKLNVLRLTSDNPPRIEFQASDVMFSVVLESFDELRTTWRLYPDQLNIVSSAGAGVVNISGVLVQHGGQAGMTR